MARRDGRVASDGSVAGSKILRVQWLRWAWILTLKGHGRDTYSGEYPP